MKAIIRETKAGCAGFFFFNKIGTAVQASSSPSILSPHKKNPAGYTARLITIMLFCFALPSIPGIPHKLPNDASLLGSP